MIVVIDTNVWISALQFAKRRGTLTLALEKGAWYPCEDSKHGQDMP